MGADSDTSPEGMVCFPCPPQSNVCLRHRVSSFVQNKDLSHIVFDYDFGINFEIYNKHFRQTIYMTKMEALAMKTVKVTTNSSYIYDIKSIVLLVSNSHFFLCPKNKYLICNKIIHPYKSFGHKPNNSQTYQTDVRYI